MKTSRLKEFADRATGKTAYEKYKNLCDESDYHSRNGILKIFDDAIVTGCSDEKAAEYVFRAIENLK